MTLLRAPEIRTVRVHNGSRRCLPQFTSAKVHQAPENSGNFSPAALSVFSRSKCLEKLFWNMKKEAIIVAAPPDEQYPFVLLTK